MNYHNQSEIIEKIYNGRLKKLFLGLLEMLDNLEPLTTYGINHTINKWLIFNEFRLLEATRDNVRELSILADQVISQKQDNDRIQNQLVKANMALIFQEIDRIKQQYVILATQKNTYGMPNKAQHIRHEAITSSTENSIELLAVNQSILNTRELIFMTAIAEGYNEYHGMTQMDNKVRQTHWDAYQDKWIRFDKPPKIGHIGTEINCRCMAIEFR